MPPVAQYQLPQGGGISRPWLYAKRSIADRATKPLLV
jgi:hypothetical protein